MKTIASRFTNECWNLPRDYPPDLIEPDSIPSPATMFTGSGNNFFRTIGQGANPNATILGFGSQQSVFQYAVNGVAGNQQGAVIPVVPELSAHSILCALPLVSGAITQWQRRARYRRRTQWVVKAVPGQLLR